MPEIVQQHHGIAHASNLESVIEKMSNPGAFDGMSVKPGGEPVIPKEVPPAALQTESNVGHEPERVEEAAVVEKPAVVAKPAPERPKTNLSRSMEIQKRAEEATRRARSEASKLRAKPAPAPAKPAVDPEIERLNAEKRQVATMRQQFEAELRQAKDSPLDFAKRHGVSGQDVAEFVKQGADPTERKIARIQAEADAKIRALEEKTNQRLSALQDTIINSQELEAQRNFFTFVEESKSVNPDAFAAIASGLVLSDKEIWDTANHLLETRKDLQNDFDEDKLLEAIEVEARKDPRWSRVQQLTKADNKTKSNVSATKQKTNAKQTEEVTEAVSQTRERPARDASTGQFSPSPSSTPAQRHQAHLEQVLRTTRF